MERLNSGLNDKSKLELACYHSGLLMWRNYRGMERQVLGRVYNKAMSIKMEVLFNRESLWVSKPWSDTRAEEMLN